MDIPKMKTSHGREVKLYTGSNANTSITICIKDEAGDAISVTTWDVKCLVKESLDATTNIVAAITGTDPGTTGYKAFDFTNENITSTYSDAVIIFYRTVGTEKYVLKQLSIDVEKSGL